MLSIDSVTQCDCVPTAARTVPATRRASVVSWRVPRAPTPAPTARAAATSTAGACDVM